MKKIVNINKHWCFYKGDIKTPTPTDKGPVYAQSKTERKLIGPASIHYFDTPNPYCTSAVEVRDIGWEYVDLPHDYIIDQDIDEKENGALGYLKYENAWYRKHLAFDKSWKDSRFTLRFDGIAGCSTIYFNGSLMKHNYSSYNSFEIDITDYVRFDSDNVLAIYVNTEEFEGWWYQGGGIYRDVNLVVSNEIAIAWNGVFAPAKKISDDVWSVDFETEILNTGYTNETICAQSQIIDSDGNIVGEAKGECEVELCGKAFAKYSAVVNNPKLWDIDNPNLYKVETKLYKDGIEIDDDVTRIGFRTVEIDVNNGLLLNGKPVYICGVCGHQDFSLTGLAVPNNIAKYKISLIKEMGANGYRTSHYQQGSAYLDACDEMGLLVLNETRWFSTTDEAFEQLDALLKRDRNRPSVIMWSTSNEEPNHITDIGRKLHKRVIEHIKKFDNTRIITAAEDKSPEESKILDLSDVIGINYNLSKYDAIHNAYPEKPIFASECCATGTTRDWKFDSNSNGRAKDKDVDTNYWFLGREKTWKFLKSKPYIFGAYQWTSIDHRGEAVWPAISSKSGAIDMFLQKKGGFYLNKSHWTKEPMVHIVGDWNYYGLENQSVNVTVYTNCDELELFLNGTSMGRVQIEEYGHGEWDVEYKAGKIEVIGYRNGKKVCSDERVTTGKPEKLVLSQINTFEANGTDLCLVLCECLDKDGNKVPDANETVTFSVSSPAVLVGTGSDNCDHVRVSSNVRKMYMGKILIAVKPSENQDSVTICATCENCGMAQIKIQYR